jgi:hypothetical protein
MFDNSSGQLFKKNDVSALRGILAFICSLFHCIHKSEDSFLCTSKNISISTYVHTFLAFPLHASKKIKLSEKFPKFEFFFNFQKFKNFQKYFRATLLC